MTAVWLWTRADLRQRWRSWVVLGLLAGATVGLAMAGVAGARRTAAAVPRLIAASPNFDAAILPNDPSFDAAQRKAVAALPDVKETYPFWVPFAFGITEPKGIEGTIVPITPAGARLMAGVILEGRAPDPKNVHELVIDQNLSRKYGLKIGSKVVTGQSVPAEFRAQIPPALLPKGDLDFSVPMRVVGISKSISSEENWSPSSAFARTYGPRLVGFVNMFVALHHGEANFTRFQSDVTRTVGHPVNVERGSVLLGVQKLTGLTDVEEIGLLLFALAVIIGGGVLVGQALVRAVTVGAADLPTWRAIGADRKTAVLAMILPAALTMTIGAVTAVAVTLALSPRFPIGIARRLDLDLGVHADWLVLGLGIVGLIASVIAISFVSAQWRVSRGNYDGASPSTVGSWAARAGLAPSLLIGSRLAVETGRGRRAVPVRSALVGAIVGVLGVVACFTFRSGVLDAVASPQRSGILWDYGVAGEGRIPARALSAIAHDEDVATALHALWVRAVLVDKVPTPTFGTEAVKGKTSFVVLDGHAPERANEIAFAPATMRDLKAHIGDEVVVGPAPGRKVRVVGSALVLATSHTGYDQSAWMTQEGLRAAVSSEDDLSGGEDYALIRWRAGTDVRAAGRRIGALTGGSSGTTFAGKIDLPTEVIELGRLRTLPLALGIFFALLGAATVAHALVTTVRRRRHDLAVLRAIGFTRRQSRFAIAWQSTLLAAAGLVIGIPLGILTGRLIWRWCADSFPLVYVPPIAAVVVLLIIPVAIALANALAAGPAHAAARIRPAEALRTE